MEDGGRMNKSETLGWICREKLVAILRGKSGEAMAGAVGALLAGGIPVMEVTMTTAGALDAIREISAAYAGRVLLGVGSVLDPETCRLALLAGAEFVVTPVVNPAVIEMCNRYAKPVACGAFTPTEALSAHEAGADIVKIFPADTLGPGYLRNLLAPMPMLRLMPTGGVSVGNAREYLDAGAVALGVGSSLVSTRVLEERDWAGLDAASRRFVAAVGGR